MIQISEHLTLDELTRSQTATRLKIDNTPSEEAKNNLKILCKNIYEPLINQFKHLRISSAYRSEKLNKMIKGAKNSQHIKGQALDIQGTKGVTNAQIFNYVKENLDFDQLIWEFGSKIEPAWVHISFKSTNNRNQILYILNK
jgi:zinc D-Ala-D-Ala carboxypeptidase